MISFMEYLLESKSKNTKEKEQKSSKSKNEVKKDAKIEQHEVLTAILCCNNFINNVNDNISYQDQLKILKNSSNKDKNDFQSKKSAAITILSMMKKYVDSNICKIIGLTDKSKNDIVDEKNIEKLVKAISAAETIQKHVNLTNIKNVYLAGNSSSNNDISKYFGIENLKKNYDIESFGMKDYNSADIVLTNDKRLIGISLKYVKTGQAEPTMINRSLNNALQNTTVQKQFVEAINICFSTILYNNIEKICKAFDNSFIKALIKQLSGKNASDYSSYLGQDIVILITNNKIDNNTKIKELTNLFQNSIKEKLNPNSDKFDSTLWTNILNKSKGFWSINNLKDIFRDIINSELRKENIFREIVHNLFKDDKINTKIAKELISVIFKCSISGDETTSISTKGLDVLKNYNFDFALCLGSGKVTNTEIVISNGKYYDIETITEKINELIKEYPIPYLVIDSIKEEKSSGTYKPFFNLSLLSIENDKTFPLANIEVRYKGEFVSSPQFQATMSKEFKDYIKLEDK